MLASPNASSCFSDVDGKQSFAVHWEPPPESIYKWRHERPKVPKSLRIYECHVGISGSESKITSFNEFTLKVIPINHGVKCIFWSQQDITLLIFIITKKMSCFIILFFFLQVLPHVQRAGYNAIQLIGVLEHKDYSSVGYKVS